MSSVGYVSGRPVDPRVTRGLEPRRLASGPATAFEAWVELRERRPAVLPTAGELRAHLGCTDREVAEHLTDLVDAGWLVEVASSRGETRRHCLTVEAAGWLHLRRLTELAVLVATCDPGADPDTDRWARWRQAQVEARALVVDMRRAARLAVESSQDRLHRWLAGADLGPLDAPQDSAR